ncbi:GntR family transcriptional regulator [Clostridium beijerinckii]|uniref:DNA-binding GntR family transcriptional regulator n=1 Tax=Clostridium beijerinckii TaxID=1520 RepID=A0AAE5EX67_CLOBE|nr:GntR family transcriptional regulator [Clostridium beijerinckii]NSB12339.1 DNA-binding GntR family transcriptional regulator [Clostridium beijerinckii]OOM30777.1 mannosyl-D-glycerate transport/metabolism system repressor MngR [Clostridium beijerinckii]
MKKREFIAQDLISKIYQHQFPNNQLPPQRSLADKYEVSRYTIQEALKRLMDMGLIYTIQGDGIYIKENILSNPLIYNSMTENSYKDIVSKTIYLKKVSPSLDIQKTFVLEENDLVWEFQRLRIVKYQITQLETSVLPCCLFPDLTPKDVEGSIQDYVQKKSYIISHYITNYKASIISKNQSELLNCKKGTPAMEITNRGILSDGTIYQYSNILALDYTCTYIIPFNKENYEKRQKSMGY